MKKLESKQNVLCWIAVAAAALGLIAFLFLPMISLSPSDVGADFEGFGGVKVEMNVMDINSGLSAVKSEALDEMGDELEDTDQLIDEFLDDYDDATESDAKTAIKLVKRFINFPNVFLAFTVIAVLGMALALAAGLMKALNVQHKYLKPWLVSVGGGVHLLSWAGLVFWVVKWLHDVFDVMLRVMKSEYPDITSMSGMIKMAMEESGISDVSVTGIVLRLLGIGLILSILCAIVLVVMGVLLTRAEGSAASEVNAGFDYGRDSFYEEEETAAWDATAPANTEALTGRIVGCSGEYAGYEIGIMPGETVNIGRSQTQCQLIVQGPKISRKHCSVTYDGDKNCYIVRDSSANGTYYMDGRRFPFEVSTTVYPGTEIYLGKKDIIFRLG